MCHIDLAYGETMFSFNTIERSHDNQQQYTTMN